MPSGHTGVLVMAISHLLSRATGATAALFLASAPFHAAPARADIVFDFSGVCDSGCTGTATGVLTLAESYTFGSDLTLASFVSFHYSSSDISFDVPKAAGLLFSGGLNANGSIVGTDLAIVGEHEFGVFPGGEFVVDVTDTGGDKGSTSDFTLVSGGVPEPTTWAMMLLGFAGLSFAKYRKTGGARTRLSVA
jgi:PEP-CTERM motif